MKKILFGIAALGLLGVTGVGLGLKAQDLLETKADGTVYYLKSDKQGWDTDNGSLTLDGASDEFTLEAGDNFKFHDGESSWLGKESLAGNAAGLFTGTDNIYVNVSGTYVFTIATVGGSPKLYIDFPDGTEFKYIGDAEEIGGDWKEGVGVAVNGSAVEFNFTATEQFKFRFGGTWADNKYVGLGFGALSSDWYGAFENNNGNIRVRQSAAYNVSLVSADHVLTLNIRNRDTDTYYVLDLNGDLLSGIHKAHYWNGTVETVSPGADMDLVPGTTSLYSFTCWDVMTGLVINGDNKGQSVDLTLTGHENKCLVLSYSSTDFKWNSNTWAELETAKFIDGYMKFNVNNENVGGTTAACATNYAAAKAAYNADSFESYRSDFCSIAIAVARLQAWAEANGEEFVVTAGLGAFSGAKNITLFATEKNENSAVTIAVVVTVSVSFGAGIFYIARKRRAE